MSTNPPALSAPRRAADPGTPAPRPAVNRVLSRVLRSSLSGAVDGALVLLTVHGRRTGREISLPVQYAVGEDAIWVLPGRPQTKTWWRNLHPQSPLRLRLRGEDVRGAARVVAEATEPALFARGRRAYTARFPGAEKAFGAAGGEGAVLVRIEVPVEALARARGATVVPGGRLSAAVRRHPLGAYFLLTYLFSWSYWIPVAVTGGRLSHFPGLLGPMLAAFVVTLVSAGHPGLRELLGRMVRWRVPVRWYAAAIIPLAAALLALVALRVAGRPLPSVDQLSDMPGLPTVGWFGVLALVLLINGYGEEAGWRGFAWPRLRERHGLAGAALILTVPWAIWHLPTFWLDTGMRGFAPFMVPGFLVGLAAGAVVLGWLYEHARRSVLVVAFWHATLNLASGTEGTKDVAAATSVVVIVWAVLILRAESRSRRADPAGGQAHAGKG